MNFKLIISVLILSMVSSAVYANEATDVSRQTPLVENHYQSTMGSPLADNQYNQLKPPLQKKIAATWGITSSQYQQYLYDIKYTPDQYFSNKAKTPLMILAIHTKDKVLRYQLLKREIEIEIKEKGAMLSALQEMSHIAHQLHPGEPAVRAPWMKNSQLHRGDVVQLYCHVNSAVCSNVFTKLLSRLKKASGARLDVFAVGPVTQKAIERFGRQNNLKRNDVINRKVTLNFAGSVFKHLEKQAGKSLPLPYVLIRRNGSEHALSIGGWHFG